MPKIWIHATLRRNSPIAAEHFINSETPVTLRKAIEHAAQNNELFLYGLIDEAGNLRKHINIFIGAKKTKNLEETVRDGDEVSIFPAVSGG